MDKENKLRHFPFISEHINCHLNLQSLPLFILETMETKSTKASSSGEHLLSKGTTSIDDAALALVWAAMFSGDAALHSAFSMRSRDKIADPTYTEATAAVAMAAATAAYDVASILIENSPPMSRTDVETLSTSADNAMSYAEAAYTVARVHRKKPASLTSILTSTFIFIKLIFTSVVRLVIWLFPWLVRPSQTFDGTLYDFCDHNLGFALDCVVNAALTSSNAAQSAVEAAVTKNKPSSNAATGLQEPQDLEDIGRLHQSSRLAFASAALANASANVVSAMYPIRAMHAARAATAAITASCQATTTRLTLLTVLSEKRYNNVSYRRDAECLRKWLTTLESFRSETEQFAFMSGSNLDGLTTAATYSVNSTLSLFKEDIRNGKITASKMT
ncbi:hypothetical protein F503_00372 [Ophiostoma piceae UAMH 11346]|uniref:Uncharacterized protein n=1 Tax=Ophiostoma piceae (strain UAMH 11346) TaxID=1262450 RepID=S3D2Y4_OPHP1|nr:hypothetical protein F503_00372 [Ophiostoma piceae UAMH 11346]